MAIIQDTELLPQAVQATSAFLAQTPVPQKQLERLFTPQTSGLGSSDQMSGGAAVLEAALKAAGAYQLLSQTGDVLRSNGHLRRDLRAAVFRVDLNFTLAARWFLLRDAFVAGERQWDDLQRTELRTWVNNQTQWINFSRWMRYLGLARSVAGVLMPDPTSAVEAELATLVGPGQELTAEEFQRKLHAQLPVLDLAAEGQFSSAVSFALEAARRAGHLTLENLADTRKFTLTLPGRDVLVTHVRGGS